MYNIVMVSAICQHESAMGIHVSSHLLLHPTCLGHHRAPALGSQDQGSITQVE